MEGNVVKAVFLDRDGVINKNRDDYVKSIEEFILLPNVPKAIKLLNKLDYKVIVITNQSVVNRGIISESELEKIHDHMLQILKLKNCIIEKIYYCPHRPDENCSCRKPKSGLFKKALEDFKINITESWFISDADSDRTAATDVQLKFIKIERNGNLLKAVKIIEQKSN